ncbi:hypothetical protein [Georgenia alba]|uniref:Uncharacterized protein n=1 Tax=Georgenia alba TaxID=2233858 RepID=A0ABW2Q835_9MICO
MTTTTETSSTTAAGLPHQLMLVVVRRLLVGVLVMAFVYAFLTTASAGSCAGAGQSTDVVPQCVDLTMGPSNAVFVALAAIVLWGVAAAAKRMTEVAAVEVLDRARFLALGLVMLSIVIAQVWLRLIPIQEWFELSWVVYPFPFADVEVDVTPMRR